MITVPSHGRLGRTLRLVVDYKGMPAREIRRHLRGAACGLPEAHQKVALEGRPEGITFERWLGGGQREVVTDHLTLQEHIFGVGGPPEGGGYKSHLTISIFEDEPPIIFENAYPEGVDLLRKAINSLGWEIREEIWENPLGSLRS